MNELNFRLLVFRDNCIDLLDNFNKYCGGYDIKNKYYWVVRIFKLLLF